MPDLNDWVQRTAHGECARLLAPVVAALEGLDPDMQADVGAFGARFRVPTGTLCEISVFGELFIVRVGDQQCVEYRVRHEMVAMQALEHLLQRYVELKRSSGASLQDVP